MKCKGTRRAALGADKVWGSAEGNHGTKLLIPSGFLVLVQPLVRSLQEFVGARSILRKDCGADADGERRIGALLAKIIVDAFGYLLGAVAVRIQQYDCEFVPT